MSRRLEGETAIITGAGRGFGEAIAHAFAREGAAVVLIARRRADIEAVATRIKAGGGRALAIPGDATKAQDVEHAVSAARARFGPVTLLVNNAGRDGPYGTLDVIDPEEWWTSMEVHLKAPMMWMHAVLGEMRARKTGRIINVASLAGRQPVPNMSSYNVGKGAQIQLSEEVAREAAEDGVSVFAVHPGLAYTELAERTLASPEAREHAAGAVAFLESRRASNDTEASLATCAEMCVDLASGRCDPLSGGFILPSDDRDALIRKALGRGEPARSPTPHALPADEPAPAPQAAE